jgi:hypothetical protein
MNETAVAPGEERIPLKPEEVKWTPGQKLNYLWTAATQPRTNALDV